MRATTEPLCDYAASSGGSCSVEPEADGEALGRGCPRLGLRPAQPAGLVDDRQPADDSVVAFRDVKFEHATVVVDDDVSRIDVVRKPKRLAEQRARRPLDGHERPRELD